MVQQIIINNFKCFDALDLEFRPLTILTGTNSSGKSSLIQAILLSGDHKSGSDILDYIESMGDFDDIKNRYTNPREYGIEIVFSDDSTQQLKHSKSTLEKDENSTRYLSYPSNLTYLNSNRQSINEINNTNNTFNQDRYFGIDGKYIANYYEKHKEEPIEEYLMQNSSVATTLEAQVNYWIKAITGQSYEFLTTKATSTIVQASYRIDGLEFKPNNIGAGISYIVAIIIATLSAKKEQIIIIENPEIHLHPQAQSKIGEFLAFVASRGVQIIIETHDDHLINRLRYEVYHNRIASNEIIIHYKEKETPFEQIEIDSKGKFRDKNGENAFPKGFYDATLKEIFEINRGK